ncbi:MULTISPECIES: cell wall hydrolase [Nitrosomonas]|uniref:Cell wall hydrolase n=1 Tax=Nitrosomonas communis TaxID=44574 RepID=A0A0F7KJN3_9PROT|nr:MULTISPECIES: cell wall hydrolase [Nitrosomonas]AKH39144.1 hypothetical protein AAW31_17075 [Nitrosomonas communis]TYP91289.1 cell wall hydrolase [Nitrosomonas communis]UVS61322.1 cell wall hydrolase [Nitrosomonas sp. PLL12]
MWSYYEIVMLALTIWREARGETREAKIAVAHTIVNRVNNPGWWGNDIISVLTKKWQYSSMTDPNDRQLTNWPKTGDPVFSECLEIARSVVDGSHKSPLKGIDSYYDDSLKGNAIPKWAKENPDRLVGKIGRLNFYNLDKDVER